MSKQKWEDSSLQKKKIYNGVASEYEMPMKSTIVIDNDFDNAIKREDKPFIWISEELFTLKRDKDKLQQENKQLKEENERYRKLGFKHLNEQNNKLKEVIEEVRERVVELKKRFKQEEHQGTAYDDDLEYEDLLQILDKVKENK